MEFGAQLIRVHGEALERRVVVTELIAGDAARGRKPVEAHKWEQFWAVVSEPRIDPLQSEASKVYPNSIEIQTDTELDQAQPIRWKGRQYGLVNAQADELLGSDLYRYVCDAEAVRG